MDWRIQIAFTIPEPRSKNCICLEPLIQKLGLPYVPWQCAIREPFDLAICASILEERPELNTTLLMLSHGPGHTKTISHPQTSENHRDWLEDRKNPKARRIIGTVNQAEANLFSKSCETFVIGDPVFDSLIRSAHRKEEFKRTLGAEGKHLVVLSSTWHDNSLIGSLPDITQMLLSRYPYDEYAFALLLHHFVWDAHSRWQINTWLKQSLRAGLILIEPERSWQAAVLAADLFIGDYGSVSLYANLLGMPCCLIGATEDNLNREYAIVNATKSAFHAQKYEHIEAFIENPKIRPEEETARIREEAFAHMGDSNRILSLKIYELLGLDWNEAACTPIALSSPSFQHEEPRSFFIVLSKNENGLYDAKRYPASIPPNNGEGILISNSDESNYRVLTNCSGIVLQTTEAERWWREQAPFADFALQYTSGRYMAIDRDGRQALLPEQAEKQPECALGAFILARRLGTPVQICLHTGERICIDARSL